MVCFLAGGILLLAPALQAQDTCPADLKKLQSAVIDTASPGANKMPSLSSSQLQKQVKVMEGLPVEPFRNHRQSRVLFGDAGSVDGRAARPLSRLPREAQSNGPTGTRGSSVPIRNRQIVQGSDPVLAAMAAAVIVSRSCVSQRATSPPEIPHSPAAIPTSAHTPVPDADAPSLVLLPGRGLKRCLQSAQRLILLA